MARVSSRTGSPVAASQILTTWSRPAVATNAESGDHATDSTIAPSQGRTNSGRPDAASKTRAEPSREAVANRRPSGDQAMCRTVFSSKASSPGYGTRSRGHSTRGGARFSIR
ncbi:hypothetical protein GCM10010271_00390 [Streptomyces kurssanovii]|nr:hypothetical protein GCM10010271_00390 [Streptomyces kurssanovii]